MQLDAIEHDAMVLFLCVYARSRGEEVDGTRSHKMKYVLNDENPPNFPRKEIDGADRKKERRRWSSRGKEIRDYASFFLHHNSSFGPRRSSIEGSRG